jgi:hypothetical protein
MNMIDGRIVYVTAFGVFDVTDNAEMMRVRLNREHKKTLRERFLIAIGRDVELPGDAWLRCQAEKATRSAWEQSDGD